jgi:hypothetical protein
MLKQPDQGLAGTLSVSQLTAAPSYITLSAAALYLLYHKQLSVRLGNDWNREQCDARGMILIRTDTGLNLMLQYYFLAKEGFS